MPELPDLTVFSENLKRRLYDRTVTGVEVHNFTKVNAATQAFESALINRQITDIYREGKETAFRFSSGAVINIHLMRFGKFSLITPDETESIKYKIISFSVDNGTALVLSDQMKMAKVMLNPPVPKSPDVLSPEFNYPFFRKAVRRNQQKNIKELLTTQTIMRGIGNAYSDEILWKANISPLNFAGRLPEDALEDLYHAIGDVLKNAIEQIRRICPDAISGEERGFLSVHNPKKEFADDGEKIIVIEQNKRGTYYTAKQVLY